jgi:hypothetical protein
MAAQSEYWIEIGRNVMRARTYAILSLIVVVLMLVAACGGGEEPKEPAKPTAIEAPKAAATKVMEEGKPEPTAVPPTATPEPPTPEPEPEPEGDLTLDTLTEGLKGLQSYRSSFKISYEGTDESGQEIAGDWETVEEFTQEPKAQRIVVEATDMVGVAAGDTGHFEFITIEDITYMITQEGAGERTCISMTSDEEDLTDRSVFTPDMMAGVSNAKFVGRETVNGTKTKHYRWSEKNIALLGFTSAAGDVWVAIDGEYVVKYTTEATGKGTFLGDELGEGKISIEYNLSEVNGRFVIEAPEDCEAPAEFPAMADAQDRAAFGGMMTYASPSEFKDVVAFYEEEMPKQGWSPGEEAMKMEGLAMLNFSKDGTVAQLLISYDADTALTNVVITSGEE